MKIGLFEDLAKSMSSLQLSVYHRARAVNVVYATVFDESPEGLTYCPKGISEDEAAFLQRIAWETVQDYQAK